MKYEKITNALGKEVLIPVKQVCEDCGRTYRPECGDSDYACPDCSGDSEYSNGMI